MELVFDITKDKEKREKGSANLVVLARERSGAELLHKAGVNNEIARLMKIEKDIPIRLNLIRCIGELCKKGIDICKDVLKSCGVPFFLDILNSKNEEVINASSYIIQVSALCSRNFQNVKLRFYVKSNFWQIQTFKNCHFWEF